MIDNYLLEELVAFDQYGTLAATADHLMVTQPTVTRGLQKLEDELQVKLFDRQPNNISLTDTGKLAVSEAKKALRQNELFVESVQQYENSHQLIKIASVAPGPLIVIDKLKNELTDKVHASNDLLNPNEVITNLQDNNYSFIVSNQEIMTDEIESRFIGTEKLSINLDKFTYLANKNSVTFSELKGLSFIVIDQIGIWKDIIQQNIPDAKFMYQPQVDSFNEITKYSNFPYFSTNITRFENFHPSLNDDDRVNVAISDDASKVDFYAVYLKDNKKLVEPTIEKISANWH
ncbi:LysR family transcriptional regulator [Companilactobacillus sp.]|jgi:DNA-binding transcriptional LysR family regulator|uniref:LysR family transcriptional regulator n=1 Tax=Companilactobacillus sp. TaxID=2767905 RepID=UPI0025BC5F0B|nr:LysR family transcriptional regulator [Companilactobacillus sp.]MCH4009704.1 LysR family transcriptional regulator [Companilactobacillus sp.]MCH4052620.1 LysR family transcriptional regulator [Companilactobacillus sp.]MCH4077646.1 LysR family transcriptional regulator [Companilactobacillus sp.]MCH4126222.1 LysR family transcriptional regulator [Companilactobacillus sp.]MCI1311930.1 LysR family transcriptional regulator [Companilactobacillus sp.]